ncbi:unnamed protein product [Caenorhabditis auriculariae]|uniref:VPS9 domain-containing protein n=1 Tax=Caenorhabditis auriculariae TaxID=2777116 RepID=A0A8S1HX04_9PELO|nr:unnamed protein product [Caenorhabditis auriculariae]
MAAKRERLKKAARREQKGSKQIDNLPSPSGSGPTASPTSTSPSATPIRRRELSPESRAAREALTDFLVSNLPTSIVQEVTRQVKHAVNKIFELRVAPEDLSVSVQGFYQYMFDKLNNSPFFDHEKCQVKPQDVMEEIEKYICTCCYPQLFCASSDEEVADESLQDRIRSLHWVTAGFLETRLDFKKQPVRDRLDEAIGEIIELNGRRSTEEKLNCLVRCSHFIFSALSESGAPTSADEFLPVLIFILLRGNPPLIQSNVKFISRFALPSRVMSGESAYFFTNLSCALQFVQDMNHNSLKMERSEFEAYTSGQLAPPLNAANCACNQAINMIESALDRVNKIDQLERRVTVEEAELVSEFSRIATSFPSEEYKRLHQTIREEEKLTMDAMSRFSRQSSDSGHGTLTVAGTASAPGSPQPQLEPSSQSPLAAVSGQTPKKVEKEENEGE